MQIRGLQDEDFVNYKKPSMFIGTAFCDWKCCNEAGQGREMCQNSPLAQTPMINMLEETIYERYISNPITKAVVLGGLEPVIQLHDVIKLIREFRSNGCEDEFIIYTGYYPNEIEAELILLKELFSNVIVKFGRYVPNQKKHFDDVLGVELASDNQWAERIC